MNEYLYWIWFSQAIKAGKRAIRLLSTFSNPKRIWQTSEDELRGADLTEKEYQRLCDKSLNKAQRIKELAVDKSIHMVHICEPGYPAPLRKLTDPPLLLYYYGILPSFENQLTLAVIGTRRATNYGLNIAGNLGYRLAMAGVTVVSGMAAGIDGAATRGALKAHSNTRPVVVLGCAVDKCYPAENEDIYNALKLRGAVLSEYAPGSTGYAYQFPERNRIVSGLSNGVAVIEAPEKSGSLITCNLTLQQKKNLFAVPGSLGLPTFEGSNRLLAEGKATVMVTVGDIIKKYPWHKVADSAYAELALPLNQRSEAPSPSLNVMSRKEVIVKTLREGEKTVDEISIDTGIDVSQVMVEITLLECTGRLSNQGGRYSLLW